MGLRPRSALQQMAAPGLLLCVVFLAFGLIGCGGNSEPSESQTKDAFLYWCNHNLDGSQVAEKVTAKVFKKEACDNPTKQGFHCTFDIEVQSANQLAGMYNNLTAADFYKDEKSGESRIRPPF
jgi:hypothetical protein